MAYIDNSETKKEINDAIRGNAVSNIAPSQLANQVIPVIDVNPKHSRRVNIVKNQNALNSTSGTIYTTPSDKDFYLVGCEISVLKDATATSTNSAINAVIKGDSSSTIVAIIRGLTLTAQENSVSNNFGNGVLLERGTNITITNTTNVANISASGIIWGYTVEP